MCHRNHPGTSQIKILLKLVFIKQINMGCNKNVSIANARKQSIWNTLTIESFFHRNNIEQIMPVVSVYLFAKLECTKANCR